jgi:hypothetical protein
LLLHCRHRSFFEDRAKDYLSRYCFLLFINAYLRSLSAGRQTADSRQTAGQTEDKTPPFSQWLEDHPELTHLCENLELA